jgi:DNA-binding response OmpR family regulator
MLAQVSPRVEAFRAARAGDHSSAAPVRLTRKEAELLAVLRQNPGRCLSREYLLATIWG